MGKGRRQSRKLSFIHPTLAASSAADLLGKRKQRRRRQGPKTRGKGKKRRH